MAMGDRITIRTPHGDLKIVITEGSVDTYRPESMSLYKFFDKGKVYE